MNIPKPDIRNNYLSHIEINSYLDYLGNRYKSFVSVYTIGQSYEGRAIKAIKIDLLKDKKYKDQFKENIATQPTADDSKEQRKEAECNVSQEYIAVSRTQSYTSTRISSSAGSIRTSSKSSYTSILKNRCNSSFIGRSDKNGSRKRKWILIEGGTHAREWITMTVALYCIYQLTEKFCRNMDILQKVKFLIIPLVNSDGYEYSRLKNPRWRKNRKPSGARSIGTDCNRNYDFHWENGTTLTSKNTYRGNTPFSEPETRAVKHVLERLGPNLIFFVSLHSCAQCIMYPWGYTKELPVSWTKLHAIAEHGKKAIQNATGRKYRCGSISQVTNRTYSGSIVDYAFGVQKVPYTLVMELPSKQFGFQPPESKIQSIGDESWIGIKAMCQRVLELS